MPAAAAAVALTGRGTLTALAMAGPDLTALWNAYSAAAESATRSLALWHETALAGGSSGQAGMAYTTAYLGQAAAGNAYQEWENAYRVWYPAPPS